MGPGVGVLDESELTNFQSLSPPQQKIIKPIHNNKIIRTYIVVLILFYKKLFL